MGILVLEMHIKKKEVLRLRKAFGVELVSRVASKTAM
jgi:hypothetical protein